MLCCTPLGKGPQTRTASSHPSSDLLPDPFLCFPAGSWRQQPVLLEEPLLLHKPPPHPEQTDQVEALPHHGEGWGTHWGSALARLGCHRVPGQGEGAAGALGWPLHGTPDFAGEQEAREGGWKGRGTAHTAGKGLCVLDVVVGMCVPMYLSQPCQPTVPGCWGGCSLQMLVVFKSAPILKRALKVKQAMMQLYVLKLLKVQTKYLGRQWRKSNMKTMSAIYQKVRHRLNDDWAYGNGTSFTAAAEHPITCCPSCSVQ